MFSWRLFLLRTIRANMHTMRDTGDNVKEGAARDKVTTVPFPRTLLVFSAYQ